MTHLEKTSIISGEIQRKEGDDVSLTTTFQKLRDSILISQRRKEHHDRVRMIAPKNILTKEQKAKIKDFYAPYGKIDDWYHSFYLQATGRFCVDYIPEDLHYCYIDPYFNDWRESVYMDDKCYYRRMFTGIRQAEEVASRIGGMWFVGDYEPITRQQLDQLLANEPEIVVKKAQGSEGGRGVFFVKGVEFSSVEGKIRDDIIIQRPIKQHPDLAAINTSSVNTIRLMSLLTDGSAKVYSGILRIGVGGSRVDNASSGGITCGITWDGKLRQYAYNAKGQRYETHPDTGVVFDGYRIPGFQKCLDQVQKLHVQIPHFRLISWDFSVDSDGEPLLVEANLHYGQLDFHQLNNGPIFGEDTKKILDEVFGKK